MSKRHVQWLYDEMPALVDQGLLPEEVAERLRRHYGPAARQDSRSVILVMFGILGAVLIGGGVILLLAHNWEQLTRPFRAALSFLPLISAQILGFWTLARRPGSTAWRESVGAAWVLSIGAAIALISQTYNLGGDFGQFLLTWILLSLPIIYLLQSSVAAALCCLGITSWAVHARLTNGVELWFWLLMALVVPHVWRVAKTDRYAPRANGLLFLLAVCISIGTGTCLRNGLDDLWMVVYSSLLGVMWFAGRRWFNDRPGIGSQPLQSLGAAGLFIMALILTFRWPWSDSAFESGLTTGGPMFWIAFILALLWVVGVIAMWGDALRRRDVPGIMVGLIPVFALVGFALQELAAQLMPLIFNVYLLTAGVVTIVFGVRARSLGVANAGLVVVSALIIVRFFDTDLDFIIRGLAFMIVGIGFLCTNLVLVKRIKEAQ